WESLFTPYNPGKGTPNLAGTWESRGLVPLPVGLTLKPTYNKKTRAYTLKGTLSEGGLPVSGVSVSIMSGASATKLGSAKSATTAADGSFSVKGKLSKTAKKLVYFKATAGVKERDYTAQGCQSPLAPTIAPA